MPLAAWAEEFLSLSRRLSKTTHTDGVVEGLVVCVEAGEHAGLGDGADDMSAYLVEVLVLDRELL